MKKSSIPFFIVIALVILLSNSVFIVPEGRQALVTQFGKIMGEPITDAGLNFKVPFLNDVRLMEKRILTWDGEPEQIPTKDKKYIWADTTARWQIIDAKKFAYTVKSEAMASTQLDSTLDGITRDVISNHNLVEVVRNTNRIVENDAEKKKNDKEKLEAEKIGDPKVLAAQVEEEISGEVEPVSVGRENLSEIIIVRARKELGEYGIQLIDVQLRRIAYEKNVESKVYDRMISERNRVAEKIRSIGQGEKAKIEGKLNKDLKEIESIAYKKSQEIKGKADATAAAIYSQSLGKGKDFYQFSRTLDAYGKTLTKKSKLLLSTDSDFFRLLNKGP